jgi:predicted dehydrogenase
VSTRIEVAIDVASDREAICRKMASRSTAVSVVDEVESSTAVITDKSDSARDAVRNGRYVLVLDPFEHSAEVRGEFASSNRAMPAHIARFLPAVRQVRQSLCEGKLGEAGLLRIHRWEQASQYRQDTLASELDLALWLFGRLPSEVYAVERSGYLQAHLGFPEGGMALIDLDQSIPSDNAYYSLTLIGSSGAAYADDHRDMNLILGHGGMHAVRTSQGGVGVFNLIDDFANAVQQGDDFSSFWDETESALQVAEDVRRAADSREVVVVGGRRA